ncbi:MAG: hypothetical protein O7D94_03180 [Planctomycetota bacterium]|nr:hypothetical protein [Planctomycetota bacterium]
MPPNGIKIAIAELQPGQVLTTPLHDAEGLLLLAAGAIIRQDDLLLLAKRNIVCGYMNDPLSAPAGSPREVRRELEAKIPDPSVCVVPVSGQAGSPRPILSPADYRAEVSAGTDECRKAIDSFQGIASDIRCGKLRTAQAPEELVRRFLGILSKDRDLLPAITGIREAGEEYLFIHSVKVAMLSITAGEALGLSGSQLMELGIGAMLMDIGMLKVPQDLRLARRDLNTRERCEIQRHPTYTLDMLEKMAGITPSMMYVGYQSHERSDGSGYPRKRSKMLMHTYARIAAIVDTYMAMTSERPYRPAFTPYESMKTLLQLGARDKFDRTILRAFLDRLSMFPVGSHIGLSTGDIARVVRPNASAHTRPVVAIVLPDGTEQDRFVDLMRTPDIQVINTFGSHPPIRNTPSILQNA